MDLKKTIRTIPDFPKPGIRFRDITPLLADHEALQMAVHRMVKDFAGAGVEKVLGIESRGFMFGAPLALRFAAGFVPVRKAGKLPYETVSASYELEYGTATLEMHTDAVEPGERVLVVDDLIATGGTMAATIGLARKLGAEVVGAAVLVELAELGGRERLGDVRLESLLTY